MRGGTWRAVVDDLADHNGLTRLEAERVARRLFGLVAIKVQAGHEVQVPDFGIFRPARRVARRVLHPRTGAPLELPEVRSVGFRPTKALRRPVR